MKCRVKVQCFWIIYFLAFFTLSGCGGQQQFSRSQYKTLGTIGEKGDISSIYKLPGIAVTPSGGTGSVIIRTPDGIEKMQIRGTSGNHYEVSVLSEQMHTLQAEDGLQSGEIQRTIHAGVVLSVSRSDKAIQTLDGPYDTYAVLSDEAVIRIGTSDSKRLYKKGLYSEDEFFLRGLE